ncbi:MAG: hypothetical protein Q8L41_11315 [Anaerolineales bacterium]|nr:hypothetical protein [Anaerolineales bacterium]
MKRILFAIPILILAISTCRPAEPPAMDQPVTSETPSAPQTGGFIPSPADSNLMRSEVYLDSTELLSMESYPLQFALVLKGNLPTPCHQLRVSVSPPGTDNKVKVGVYSVSNPDGMCAQVLEPFEINFPLGRFPEGRYTLWVNGEMVAGFQS